MDQNEINMASASNHYKNEMDFYDDQIYSEKLDSTIFTEHVPILGRIPMGRCGFNLEKALLLLLALFETNN